MDSHCTGFEFDLTMISVGVGNINKDELKLIATDPSKHVFTAKDFTALLQLVKKLQTRTCTTPVQMTMDFTQNENNTIVTAYVFPGNVRYFALASENFYGVGDIFIAIKPIFGSLSLYASRFLDTPGPNNHTYKLDPILTIVCGIT
ncbi:hypothetical protein QZH41_003058 [Actinostola sp. cb2023]|nr:hypothetical protein QZH41_003058 [Actinostola sp. cb2023]